MLISFLGGQRVWKCVGLEIITELHSSPPTTIPFPELHGDERWNCQGRSRSTAANCRERSGAFGSHHWSCPVHIIIIISVASFCSRVASVFYCTMPSFHSSESWSISSLRYVFLWDVILVHFFWWLISFKEFCCVHLCTRSCFLTFFTKF